MEKVIIDFDLNDEQMIREAIRNYDAYEDFLVGLIQHLNRTSRGGCMFTTYEYEEEFMKLIAV